MTKRQYRQIARDNRLAVRRANKLPRLMRWVKGMTLLRQILRDIEPKAKALASAHWAFDNLITEKRKEARCA